jgi:D-alanine-D-alanine ligase
VNQLPITELALQYPVIVKPAKQDASIGLDQRSVCTTAAEVDDRVRYILETYGPPVLVEEYILGREFNVALMELPELRSLPPSEILFPPQTPGTWSILTYEGKWTPGSVDYDSTPPKCPADLPAATIRKLGRLAMQAHRLLGCRDYARVDFRLSPEGKPYILEINPNPEISDQAGFACCLKAAGISHQEFVTRLVEQTLARRHVPRPTFAPVRPTAVRTGGEASPAQ